MHAVITTDADRAGLETRNQLFQVRQSRVEYLLYSFADVFPEIVRELWTSRHEQVSEGE